MIDGDGGIDIDVQPAIVGRSSPCGPGPLPSAARIRGSRAASMRSSTSRHSVVVEATGPNACSRSPPQLTDPIDAVRAVGHRGGQIGEHIPGRMRPRPLVRVRQRGCDCLVQLKVACSAGRLQGFAI